jgi:hypothetical protein
MVEFAYGMALVKLNGVELSSSAWVKRKVKFCRGCLHHRKYITEILDVAPDSAISQSRE